MNNFINWIKGIINEGYEDNLQLEDITTDLETHFNLIYTADIKRTFEKYSLEIMEIYFQIPEDERRTLNSIDNILVDTILYTIYNLI